MFILVPSMPTVALGRPAVTLQPMGVMMFSGNTEVSAPVSIMANTTMLKFVAGFVMTIGIYGLSSTKG